MSMTEDADRARLRDLLDLYHAAINFRDWSLLPRIFLPDAVWLAHPPLDLRYEGLAAIEAGFRANVERQELLVQSGTGLAVDFEGSDKARLRSTLVEIGREPGKSPWLAVVFFTDRAQRTGEGWRLVERGVRLGEIINGA